jgi:alkanesulfonate monooxygenase SsuD/methylene tetrahydromethanopterin reductase-like flavin-dependent oxidoreductase (luciferase family)
MPVPTTDPWVALGALAVQTRRITIGTAITPVARRQPRELARQTVTVDHLSGGRLVLGVGLGEPPEEYTAYGESAEPHLLAERLDEGLEVLTGLWSGEPFDHDGTYFTVEGAQYLPTPVQQPRIPVWAGCTVPHTRPLLRAACWDGLILVAIGGSGRIDPVPPAEVHRALERIAEHRDRSAGPLDVAVSHSGLPSDDEMTAYSAVGVTWVLVAGWLDELDRLIDLVETEPALVETEPAAQQAPSR